MEIEEFSFGAWHVFLLEEASPLNLSAGYEIRLSLR